MNRRINEIIGWTMAILLIVSLLAVATLPAVLAWWDQNLFWLLLYLTYPVALISIAATIGSARSNNEEKRKNSNEYC